MRGGCTAFAAGLMVLAGAGVTYAQYRPTDWDAAFEYYDPSISSGGYEFDVYYEDPGNACDFGDALHPASSTYAEYDLTIPEGHEWTDTVSFWDFADAAGKLPAAPLTLMRLSVTFQRVCAVDVHHIDYRIDYSTDCGRSWATMHSERLAGIVDVTDADRVARAFIYSRDLRNLQVRLVVDADSDSSLLNAAWARVLISDIRAEYAPRAIPLP